MAKLMQILALARRAQRLLLIALVVLLSVLSDSADSMLATFWDGNTPQPVTVREFCEGKIGAGRYIALSGTTERLLLYTVQDETGNPTGYYYLLATPDVAYTCLFYSTYRWEGFDEVNLAVEGITHKVGDHLAAKLDEDEEDFLSVGAPLPSRVYLEADAKPWPLWQAVLAPLAVAALAVLLLLAWFAPREIFRPQNVPLMPAADADLAEAPALENAWVSGRLLALDDEGKPRPNARKRRFVQAVANVVWASRGMFVFVREERRTRVYGVTVARRKSNWGVFLAPHMVMTTETGKMYGPRTYWALRVHYRTDDLGEETITLLFPDEAALRRFVRRAVRMGFPTPAYAYAPVHTPA